MTTDNKSVTLGMIGENLIKNKIVGATKTDDWYDSEKDGTIGTQIYEVKTLRLNHKHQGIVIDITQWNKIDNVDINFWVRVPESVNDKIKYYRYHAKHFKEMNMNGTRVRVYPIGRMEYIGTEKNPNMTTKMLSLSKRLSKHKRFTKNSVQTRCFVI
jgi:hypothetical protein